MKRIHKLIELTLVIEWENILLSKKSRCFKLLKALGEQINEIEKEIELLIISNSMQVSKASIKEMIGRSLIENNNISIKIQMCDSKEIHYYELKNKGANLAKGDIVIFIDSDIIPERNWLQSISDPFFKNPEIEVLAGSTYICHDTIFEKAFALGWFFPLRNSHNIFHSRKTFFFANNVAFRKNTIQKNPFPKMPDGVSRGACTKLAKQLLSNGVKIWENTEARAHHPPPSNLKHYLIRGLVHGKDLILKNQQKNKSNMKLLSIVVKWSFVQMLIASRNIIMKYRAVSLQNWQIPVALIIMLFFYQLAIFGSIFTIAFPQQAKKYLRI